MNRCDGDSGCFGVMGDSRVCFTCSFTLFLVVADAAGSARAGVVADVWSPFSWLAHFAINIFGTLVLSSSTSLTILVFMVHGSCGSVSVPAFRFSLTSSVEVTSIDQLVRGRLGIASFGRIGLPSRCSAFTSTTMAIVYEDTHSSFVDIDGADKVQGTRCGCLIHSTVMWLSVRIL